MNPAQKPLLAIFEEIVARYEMKKEKGHAYRGSCPAHDSKSGDGFVVTLEHDRILLTCHGGCTFDAMVAAMGHQPGDMFAGERHGAPLPASSPPPPPPPMAQPMREGNITVYRYYDARKTEVYRVRREDFPDKPRIIRPYQQIGNEWKVGLDDRIRRVPYNLAAFSHVRQQDLVLYFVEGEKCADRLIESGIAATCTAGGAGGWT